MNKFIKLVLTLFLIWGVFYLGFIWLTSLNEPAEDKIIKRNLSPYFDKISQVFEVSYPVRSGDRLFGGVEVTSVKGHKYEFEIPEISAYETASSLSLLEFDDYFFKCRNSVEQELTKGMDIIQLRVKLGLPDQIIGINTLFEHEAKFVEWLSTISESSDLTSTDSEICLKYRKH